MFLSNSTQPLLKIWHGGSNDEAEETVKLDRESRKYIKVKLHQVEVTYDKSDSSGSVPSPKKKDTEFDLIECKEEMFKTEFEKIYYKQNVKGNNHYCVDDPDGRVYLNGTKND